MSDDIVLTHKQAERIHDQVELIRCALGTLYAVMDALEAVGLDKAARRLGEVDLAIVQGCNRAQAALRDSQYLREAIAINDKSNPNKEA